MDVSGGESKVQFYKEQYCIGTWYVRSISQGKLDMVKEEMARANICILGISELNWIGMGKFNSDGNYQMVNTKIRLIIFPAAKDEEALHRQQNET